MMPDRKPEDIYKEALAYETGDGVKEDQKKAFELLEQAAEGGHLKSQLKLSKRRFEGNGCEQRYHNGYYWLYCAAEQGSEEAKQKLSTDSGKGIDSAEYFTAHLYLNGKGFEKDKNKGMELLRSAANKGRSFVQFSFAVQLHQKDKTIDEANEWYRKSACQGNEKALDKLIENAEKHNEASANFQLGLLYRSGKGVEKNLAIAYKYLRHAAEAGFEQAKIALLEKIDDTNPHIQYNLAVLYANGKCIEQDLPQACSLYKNSAEQGHKAAQFALGKRLISGQGIDEDKGSGYEWLYKAANEGHMGANKKLAQDSKTEAEAKFYYAQILEQKRGGKRTYKQAFDHYKGAAESGHVAALKRVRRAANKHDDSSDEEEITGQNEQFDLFQAFGAVDFATLARNNGLGEEAQVKKSWWLHTIGKMVIYSPDIETYYRAGKFILLSNPSTAMEIDSGTQERPVLEKDSRGKITTEALRFDVRNLQDLLVLGRVMGRSMKREYRNLPWKTGGRQIKAEIQFKKNHSEESTTIFETLVYSEKGLSKKNFPSSDMVELHLTSGKGDYQSAYRGNTSTDGLHAVERTLSASQSLSRSLPSPKTEKKETLDNAILVIDGLKEEIAKHFPAGANDVFIAESIRKICRGESLMGLNENAQKRLHGLTYLLFKTEVHRSPAALVNNIQMLEMIINKQMTFKEAFSDMEMPMSMKGAIKAARKVDEAYNTLEEQGRGGFYRYHNPYGYYGDYSDERSGLIKKESALMDKWLKMKFPDLDMTELNEENLPMIGKEIYGSIQSFGLNVTSPALHRMQDSAVARYLSQQAQVSEQQGIA